MIRLPQISTRTSTLFPYPPRFRSAASARVAAHRPAASTASRWRRGCVQVLLTPVLLTPVLLMRHRHPAARSEEHTSELQSLMRISYAVFCLKNKIIQTHNNSKIDTQTQ